MKMYMNAETAYDFLSDFPATNFLEVIEDEEWELMQYTGLKDMNGKEIYEGDIVDITSPHHRNIKTLQEVVFRDGSYQAKYSDFGWEGEDIIHLPDCKVVGNIYEDKELIEKIKG